MSTLNRRTAMLAPFAAGAAATVAATGPTTANAQDADVREGSRGCSTPLSAIAKTQYGKVRGYLAGNVLHYKGVPYGADTGGENRWLPAKPPKPWDDVYPALAYGANCPQTKHSFDAKEHTFLQQWTDGFVGEDMLKLNIWTPALTGNRPVMVYLHGGGFAFGSSYELASHDGAQMARNHDVVQVSVNHRLNVLGFMDLSDFGGAAYEGSVNVSMTDLVAALKWVRDNIANFGGDPDCVTIYGQSGGGSKVTTLMGMPQARGLFHRAIAQSGGGGNIPDAGQSKAFSAQIIKELGIGNHDMAALQKMDWDTLIAAGNRAAAQINGPAPFNFMTAGVGDKRPSRVGWVPTVDGQIINMRSFFDKAPDISSHIPMIMGSVSEEGMRFGNNPTEAEWRQQLTQTWGAEKANNLVNAMKAAHPEKAIRTLSYGVGGLTYRNNLQRMVSLRYAQKAAPVYQYYFDWQTPQLDGVAGAWHTAELAFCFDNTQRCELGTGDTPQARALATKMSRAWASFARTGNPSQPGLAWTPTDPVKCQTMVFNNHTRMENDPEGDLRRILLG